MDNMQHINDALKKGLNDCAGRNLATYTGTVKIAQKLAVKKKIMIDM